MAITSDLHWHRVADLDELPEGRVKTVAAGTRSLALTHVDGQYSALDNRCPHQGGPLGEGSIERGLLRCPWHGYDYCPLSGDSPGGFGDSVPTHPVDVRDDGIWVGVADEAPHVRTVSDVMAETLANWGVRHVFGMVGHSNLGLADAIRRLVEAGRLDYIGIRHEGAAAFAASAYAKLTGSPAACLTIAGPGATNLLTGLWDAKVDRAPVIALTGQVATSVLGVHNFQEIDLRGAFGTVASFSQTVLPSSPHAALIGLAVKHAILTPGVSHLLVPDEVQTIPAAAGATAGVRDGRIGDGRIQPPAAALEEARKRIAASRRPVIIVGHGARFDMESVTALADQLGAPVITTFKAKGQIADDHPLACGVLGRSGTPVASWVMNEADLLLVFGASFSNHTGIYAGHPIIQVDHDPAQLGKFHAVAVPVQGDVGVTARLLADGASPGEDQAGQIAERWALWRAEKASRRVDDRGTGVNSASIFESLSRVTPEDAVLAVDVGNNAYSFGRYFECKRGQSVLMSGYLGSIGFAYPAAIGAWAAVGRSRKVIAVSGDGGFGQYLAELTTAVKYDMDITHVLVDNGQLGKISEEQRAGEWEVWQPSLHNPDFSEYARICGGPGIKVTNASQFDDAIAQGLAHDGPALIHVVADPDLI